MLQFIFCCLCYKSFVNDEKCAKMLRTLYYDQKEILTFEEQWALFQTTEQKRARLHFIQEIY